MSLRCTARWTGLTNSARPKRVTGRHPPTRRLQAQKRAERSSCTYRLRSALGSTALATIGLVEGSSGAGAQPLGHSMPQTRVIIDPRPTPAHRLVVRLKKYDRSSPIRDDEL